MTNPSHASPGPGEVAFDTADGGRPDARPVVLLHGFLFDRSMWRTQVAGLADRGFRVVAVDLPGFGASPPPAEPATMGSYAAAVAALVERLALPPVTLVGYSMGGQVALELCATRPELVERLVLVDTVAHVDSPEVAQGRRELADRLEREGVAAYAEEFLPKLVELDGAAPGVEAHARAMMRASDPRGAALALRARADRTGYEHVLDTWPEPALVVVGERDPFDQAGHAAAMARRLPAGELVVVPGVGHTPPLEAPDELTRILADFLRRA